MKVEIWSDLVCPWCYIGKRRFEAALEMKERLLRAYFTEGKAISDRAELSALAGEAGLDPHEVERMFAGDTYVEAVRADEARARSLGIRGVPFFLIDGEIGISGAHPTAKLREALEAVGTEE